MPRYVLFSSKRKPEVLQLLEHPEEVLPSTLVFDAGAIFSRGSLQIDAKLRNSRVFSQGRHPILLSALGQMAGCTIIGQDVVIDGDFAGRIEAAGDVEVTSSARISGVISCAGKVFVSQIVNRQNLRIERPTLPANQVLIEGGRRTQASPSQQRLLK